MRIKSSFCNKCGKQSENGYCKECDSATVGGTGRIFIIINIIVIGIILIYLFTDLF